MKAQLSESVSFVLLIITITFFIVLSRIFILGDATQSLSLSVIRTENERLKGGVNALFLMSDEKYGISLLDLAGRGVSEKTDIVYVGATLAPVNVSEELEWRMNAMFGKNWHMTIPFLEKPEYVTQIVLVADVSRSLCDDLNNLKKLPAIIEDINKRGRKVFATLYLLGRSNCEKENLPEIVCSDFDTEHFRCIVYLWTSDTGSKKDRDDPKKPVDPSDIQLCKSVGKPGDPWKWDVEEDWGSGIACASKSGPLGGWAPEEISIRLGIAIGDELPGGSECGCKEIDIYYGCRRNDACASCDVGSSTTQNKALQRGINEAKKNKVKVFGLFGESCSAISALGTPFEYICTCKPVLKKYMDYISSQTGGKSFALSEAAEISKIIENIIITAKKDVLESIDIGHPLPRSARIYRYEILVPTTGNYTKAIAYTW